MSAYKRTTTVDNKPVIKSTLPVKAASGEAETAVIQICASIPWAAIIQQVTPYVKKYTIELLTALGSQIKKLATSCKCASGSCTSFPTCCQAQSSGSNPPATKTPGYTIAPGNKKSTNNNTGNSSNNGATGDSGSVIDYPNPFQEKLYEDTPAASTSTKRLSVALKKRLSRVPSRVNRSSIIADPVSFDIHANV